MIAATPAYSPPAWPPASTNAIEPVDAQLHPAVGLGQLLGDDGAAQRAVAAAPASRAWTASSSRLASLGGPVLFSGEPLPTSGATHGTAAQLPPSSTKVALPWTRSRSPALLPPCLMPRTPFSVAPSSVANAEALRPFHDAKSTSWFSFSSALK